jgi:hypothetical protein
MHPFGLAQVHTLFADPFIFLNEKFQISTVEYKVCSNKNQLGFLGEMFEQKLTFQLEELY